MRKIPTLFRRDPKDRRYVLPEVTPGCEWVLNGEGRDEARVTIDRVTQEPVVIPPAPATERTEP